MLQTHPPSPEGRPRLPLLKAGGESAGCSTLGCAWSQWVIHFQQLGPALPWEPAVPSSPAALRKEVPLLAPVPELLAQQCVNQGSSEPLSLGDWGTSPETPTKQEVNLKLRAPLPRLSLPRPPFSLSFLCKA